ncbi:hypothetical protein SH2C18_11940 [Clostridium sediminicola]|uniref:flagellar hook-length control protein FliK n=1 Tax=Clostridium sediminicola TaxID=3114879 RepID=UPI0031F1FF7B
MTQVTAINIPKQLKIDEACSTIEESSTAFTEVLQALFTSETNKSDALNQDILSDSLVSNDLNGDKVSSNVEEEIEEETELININLNMELIPQVNMESKVSVKEEFNQIKEVSIKNIPSKLVSQNVVNELENLESLNISSKKASQDIVNNIGKLFVDKEESEKTIIKKSEILNTIKENLTVDVKVSNTLQQSEKVFEVNAEINNSEKQSILRGNLIEGIEIVNSKDANCSVQSSELSQLENINSWRISKISTENTEANVQNMNFNSIEETNNNFEFIIKGLEPENGLESEKEIQNFDKVVSEISEKINILKDNSSETMKIKLKPQELGELSIELEKKGNDIVARVLVHSNETKQLIEKNMTLLHNSISNYNVKVTEVNVDSQANSTMDFSFNQGSEDMQSNSHFFDDQEEKNNGNNNFANDESYDKTKKTNKYKITNNLNQSSNNINILM